MNIGESWAYRARAKDPLAEVQVVKIGSAKPARVLVRFVAEEFEGREEWVPPARLKVLWAGAEEFAARERRWEAVSEAHRIRGSAAEYATDTIFDLLISPDLAINSYQAPGVCHIKDAERLGQALGLDPAEFRTDPLSFDDDGELIVPWPVTETIARRAAELNPDPVLRQVAQEEAEQQRKMTHGEWVKPWQYNPEGYHSPEFIAEMDEEPTIVLAGNCCVDGAAQSLVSGGMNWSRYAPRSTGWAC